MIRKIIWLLFLLISSSIGCQKWSLSTFCWSINSILVPWTVLNGRYLKNGFLISTIFVGFGGINWYKTSKICIIWQFLNMFWLKGFHVWLHFHAVVPKVFFPDLFTENNTIIVLRVLGTSRFDLTLYNLIILSQISKILNKYKKI